MSTAESAPTNDRESRGVFTPELLGRCISCGFCLPACPTYALTGVETSSPRGRINLMRALETGVLPDDDPTVYDESSFCLGCRACEPVCPRAFSTAHCWSSGATTCGMAGGGPGRCGRCFGRWTRRAAFARWGRAPARRPAKRGAGPGEPDARVL